jgi:hypothetical protein
MMALPPLPPRRFSIPTHVIFGSQLPPAVFLTWLQLRSLTWCGQELPPFSLQAWVDLTGTSRTTFLRHLAFLQEKHALRWSSTGRGLLNVSFIGASFPSCSPARSARKAAPPIMGTLKKRNMRPVAPQTGCSQPVAPQTGCSPSLTPSLDPDPAKIPVLEPGDKGSGQAQPEQARTAIERESLQSFTSKVDCPKMRSPNLDSPDSQNRESPSPLSLNLSLSSPLNSFKDQGIKDLDLVVMREGKGERECEGERDFLISENSEKILRAIGENPPNLSKNGQPPDSGCPPITDGLNVPTFQPSNVPTLIAIYQELTGLTPSPHLTSLILENVTNNYLWNLTIEHWLWHKWDPHDVPGLLDLYYHNADIGCRACHKDITLKQVPNLLVR